MRPCELSGLDTLHPRLVDTPIRPVIMASAVGFGTVKGGNLGTLEDGAEGLENGICVGHVD